MFLYDEIHDLSIRRTSSTAILLQQTVNGEAERISIHPVQLRYIAEQFGLIAPGDQDAAKAIAAMQRRLKQVRDRARHQVEILKAGSPEHAYAEATAAIVDEYCADLVEQVEEMPPLPTPVLSAEEDASAFALEQQ